MMRLPSVSAFLPRRRLGKRLGAGAMLLAGLALTVPATSAQSEQVSLTFDLFTKGTRVYAIDLDIDLAPSAYKARLDAQTVGLASWFIDESFTMRGAGALTGNAARPASFYERKDEDGESKSVEVAWSGGNVTARRSYTLDEDRAAAVERAVSADMPDPIAAILTHAVANAGNPCRGSQRIYNGKEVFDFDFTFVKEDSFGSDDAGVYRGTAYQCTVEYKAVAGQSERKLRKLAKERRIYRVWFAPVESEALDRALLLPVAATGKVKGRDVVIYTRAATIAGRPLNRQSLASRR